MHEAQMHEANCFVTLTYDDHHLPHDRGLRVEHWQNFAKALRRKCGRFRFFHCGEYGESTFRPHYHAVLHGLDFRHDRVLHKKTKTGDPLWTSPTLSEVWTKGHHLIGGLSFESAAYVARYVVKKVTGEQAQHYYETVNAETGETYNIKSEYCTMSRRPGIGKTWIDTYMRDVYPRDEVIARGHPSKPPKFYDEQLEKFDSKLYLQVKQQRVKEAQPYEEHTTYDRLAVREEVKKAQIRHLKRELNE